MGFNFLVLVHSMAEVQDPSHNMVDLRVDPDPDTMDHMVDHSTQRALDLKGREQDRHTDQTK